jgi:hypothetical protein
MADGNHTQDNFAQQNTRPLVESGKVEAIWLIDLPPMPVVDDEQSYQQAQVQYKNALASIEEGDWRSIMAARADDLCALIVNYELENGIKA